MSQNNVEQVYELSPVQQAMLFHGLYAPGSGVYVVQLSLRLSGQLDVAAFERAWQNVVERHAILRTAFFWEGLEKPMQVVYSEVELDVRFESWRNLGAGEWQERLVRFKDADREEGFDLSDPPLIRLALFELEPEVHQLVWSQHHILIDGWSQGLLLKELFTSYESLAGGHSPTLGRAPAYRDFIAWLQRQDMDRAEHVWRRHLAGLCDPTYLVEKDPLKAATDFRGSRKQARSLSAGVTDALNEAARHYRLTLNTLIQGAWAYLIGHTTQGRDIVFGATVAGRPAELPGVERIVGPFINTLPVHVKLRRQRLVPWLRELQEQQAELRQYDYAPLYQVQKWCELSPGAALFDHILAFENYPLDRVFSDLLPSLRMSEVSVSELTNYPLAVKLSPGPELQIEIDYEVDRIEATAVARLLERFSNLLRTFASEPDIALSELPLLLPGEHQQLLAEWNDTSRSYPASTGVPTLFEHQARARGEAVTVVAAEKHLSYRELDRRSERLAATLLAGGLRPEAAVGVCLERSAEMVMAMLAITKAGGTYVPLDPAYPAERISFMVSDVAAEVIVTVSDLVWAVAPCDRRMVCLDVLPPAKRERRGASPTGVGADRLAYVMFTSGSTGRPKGVGIPHRAIVRLVTNSDFTTLDAERIFLQFASTSFDASTLEIWGALLNGAKVVIFPPSAPGLAELGEVVARERITTLFLTTGLFHQVGRGPHEPLQGIEELMFGGDLLSTQRLQQVRKKLPSTRLAHVYGPTENTTFSTWYPVTETPPSHVAVPIGRAISNSRVYLVNRHLCLVAFGVPGELAAGGDGLARGYLGRPALTAERFVPDPFANESGGRLYRTGDLVKWRTDGQIEFVGRVDLQVKVRGFRVELGEIESALTGHPDIADGVVVAWGSSADEKRLVAYVVARDQETTASELRSFLYRSLPDHMVPAVFVFLDALPLTPNGKVDRKKLPAPTAAGLGRRSAAVARTPLQELVAGIWSQVLDVEDIGVDDDFFELGGHSLLATQVLSRVKESLEIETPLQDLFTKPTVAAFAEHLATLQGAAKTFAAQQAPPLLPASREDASSAPLSFAQKRLWLTDRLGPGNPSYNLPMATRIRGELDRAGLEWAVCEITKRHETLRTRFVEVDGDVSQVVLPSLSPGVPEIDLQGLPAECLDKELDRLRRQEILTPFDLSTGPLLRLSLIRLGRRESVVLTTLHHITSDGWSMGIFLRELVTFYRAYLDGTSASLGALPVQYADFSRWQRRWLQGDVLESALRDWKERLAGAPQHLELPPDHARPTRRSGRGAGLPFHISKAERDRLRQMSQEQGVTLYMTLLATLQALLSRLTGSLDIVVGSPIAGRNRIEIEGLIGFFVNTLVMRTTFYGDPTFEEILERARTSALAAYANQELPFDRLVEELGADRDPGTTPVFQVMFAFQAALWEPFELPDLVLEPLAERTETAKVDLTFAINENPGGDMTGLLEYSTDLFDRTTMVRFLESFRNLLHHAVEDPEKRLGELVLLTPAQCHEILTEWNDTDRAYPRDWSVPRLFERQVRLRGEAVAVVAGDRHSSYEELDLRAEELGSTLRSYGVGPEIPVGLCLERSVEMVVAILAVLKAGGAYVPLDPAYPDRRLSFMVSDVAAPILVTVRHLAPAVGRCGARILCLDDPETLRPSDRPAGPRGVASGDHLAYVMYTSGSTGRPKGVAVAHHSIVRLVQENDFADLNSNEVFLKFASTSFDASTFEIWGSLLNGARLVVYPAATPGLEELGNTLTREKITSLWLTAGLFHQMVDGPMDQLRGLRQLLAGGDVLSPLQVERVLRELPTTRMINGYGPTENTTFTCCHTVAALPKDGTGVPVGRPISNTRVYITDRGLRSVAMGVSGELCTGGDGLARGYTGRPALTAERFVPDPFGNRLGSRLYRTGDLTRRKPRGAIEFLGRVDHQIKVRGFRVELGEIETALLLHPQVREAVVLAMGSQAEDKRLVTFLVPDGAAVPPDPLRGFLRQILPEHMVPSVFVALDEMPLNPNGKIDRAWLASRPLPETIAADREIHAGPRTSMEELVMGIWAQVLEREKVSRNDDFFDLGGHSLLAIKVLSRVKQSLGIDVSMMDLFTATTVADFAEVLESSRPSAQQQAPPLDRRAAERSLEVPLSFAQQRLWLIDQLEPGNAAYNLPMAMRVRGDLDRPCFEWALSEIVRRHESLRTTFREIDGRARQLVSRARAIFVPEVDLRGLEAAQREAELGRLGRQEARLPFDLSAGPVLRIRLLHLASGDSVVLVVMHHISSDGWSMGIFVRELVSLYDVALTKSPSPIDELPVQYGDFSLWQHRWLRGEVLQAEIEHWREILAGAPPQIALPVDRPHPAERSFRGAGHPFRLGGDLRASMLRLSQENAVTMFMASLAAFQAYLGRLTGTTDIVVGSPVAGRGHVKLEGLIGFFVNTLVLRTSLSSDLSFQKLLSRVREVTLTATAHQDLPFERLVEELVPNRDLRTTPLFQVMFTFQGDLWKSFELPGLVFEPLELRSGTAKFDLMLGVEEKDAELRGLMEYNVDLFDATTIARFVDAFRHLVQGVVTEPDRRLGEIILLSIAQQHEILSEWNDTLGSYSSRSSLQELFESWVERTPEALAVTLGEDHVSYRELNLRSNRLAHLLLQLGVGKESRVGLAVERSTRLLVGMLGILKAGGAYVPLDRGYPQERLDFMIEDTGIRALVFEGEFKARDQQGTVTVELREDHQLLLRQPSENPRRASDGSSLAYIVYTSGSTGRPKGVGVEHRAVSRLVLDTDYVRLTTSERISQVANTSFDAVTFEVWGPLLNGGSVVGLDQEAALSPRLLGELLRDLRITSLFLTTALFNQIARENPTAFQPLLNLLVGGESLDPNLIRKVLRAAPPERLLNVYGPTESTTFATWHPIRALLGSSLNIPIGRPIKNTRTRVLDRLLRPVVTGVTGELYLGGAGLARGYLGRAALTADRFIPDLDGVAPGDRLYRTGDLVRQLGDGAIEFLGRFDHQVKMRGFRIELAEIERTLIEHSTVKEAVVLLRDDLPGGPGIVAYTVLEADAADDAEDLKGYLRHKLPAYMIPGYFLHLEELPLTSNAKIDRAALPNPLSAGASDRRDVEAPRYPLERIVADIWAEVLGRRDFGIHDDFFELGGHSLLATQVVSRVRESLGREVSLREVFSSPTVALLAERLGQKESAPGAGDRLQEISHQGPEALPLSFAQQRLWWIDRLNPGDAAYNMPMAMCIQGELSYPALEGSVGEIVLRHEILRTSFHDVDGEARQVVDPTAKVAVPQIDLSTLDADRKKIEVDRLTREESLLPFHLEQSPLIRIGLIRIEVQEWLMLVTMHHIVSDGWSMGIFRRELAAFYRAFHEGSPSPLEELPMQYADFARWQRQSLREEALESEISYWKENLSGISQRLLLPADRPLPSRRSSRGDALPLSFQGEFQDAIRRLGQASGATLYMTFLAAWKAFLARVTGSEDIVVGSPVAGRKNVEIEKLIGFFVNTLVLRTRLHGNPSFVELLARVREGTLDALIHQDLPFDRLVEELQPERDLSTTPIFQVMFTFQAALWDPFELHGLTFKPLLLRSRTTKFDLSFGVEEVGEELEALLEFNTDLFDPSTIARFLRQFRTMLHGLVADPHLPLADLALLDHAEEQQLREWNDTHRPSKDSELLHRRFEKQARVCPEAAAVVFADRALSYAELDRRADRLAHQLVDVGVGPEIPVGALLERSAEMVVAFLGTLKAGGAYVPLDPSYPEERLYLMNESVSVLVADSGTAQAHKETLSQVKRSIPVLHVGLTPSREKGAALFPTVRSENTAYMVFTSGSTGRPKGVMISHRAISNHMTWIGQNFPISAGDSFLQKTPASFDASIWETWAPLLAGSRLVMAHPSSHRDPAALTAEILRHRVTHLQVVPSFLSALLLTESFVSQDQLIRVFSGGELLPAELQARFRHLSGAKLWNLYGPTEATINATFTRSDPTAHLTAAIGRPIANVKAHVLDRSGRLAPIGVAGELCISGEALARGYLLQPGKTAECYRPDPIVELPGERTYHTGDLGRLLPGGKIELLGRRDRQIKVRGFRIEPGEIEKALLEHSAVRSAIVVISKTPSEAGAPQGHQHLVAHLIAGEPAPAAPELRHFLRQRLPEHMVPSRFRLWEALPILPNGKIDRKTLESLRDGAGEILHADEFVVPRGPVEELLADIWKDILNLSRVGIEDNFFDLGGHSLLATRVVARIRQVFGVEIELRTFFESPIIASLSARIGMAKREGGVSLPPLAAVSRETPLPLSFAQQRLWLLDRLMPENPAYNMPGFVTLRGSLDTRALRRAFRELVARHESLRTRFPLHGQTPVQEIVPVVDLRVPLIHLGALPEDRRRPELRWLLREEQSRPFQLTEAPLIRVRLIRIAPGEHTLAFNMHHIASDGWSMGVFYREIIALYEAFVEGRPSPLPALAVQYADFSVWQREWLRGKILESQLDYWKTQLKGVPTEIELPYDRPRPAVDSFRGAVALFRLRAVLKQNLSDLAQRRGATLSMALLTGMKATLARYSGQTDLAVGMAVANRQHLELEPLIGFFVNTLVLRTDLGGAPGFTEALDRVRDVAIGAYTHQDLPFDRLVEEIETERRLGQNPLTQAMFGYQNFPHTELEAHGLTFSLTQEPGDDDASLSPLGDGGTSKFDLTVLLAEDGDELQGSIEYRSDLFDATTIRRLARHLETLLERATADPQTPITSLSLFDPAERHQLLIAWNATEFSGGGSECLHRRFEAQAARSPEATAVVFADRALSYTELERRSDDLAVRLTERGVGPEVRVGIALERSLEMVISLLGILKAGGAYVPLDPSYPKERLRLMMDEAIAVLITDEENALPLTEGRAENLPHLPVLGAGATSSKVGGTEPMAPVRSENTAYVIYTSGSTGRPKGVMISHRAISNHMAWIERSFPWSSGDSILQKTPTSFDASVWEFWAPLLTGGRLVVALPGTHRDPDALASELLRHRVTHLQVVPSLLDPLLSVEEFVNRNHLRRVFCGGEVLTPEAQARFHRVMNAELWNLYGPTESTIDAVFARCEPGAGRLSSAIGRPVDNVRAYVLDRAGHPVPYGVKGEICLAGKGLARGYLYRPGPTAASFRPNPVSAQPGDRLYHSGDLGRLLAAGKIDFVGRRDHQIKIRGFRIEPGEIEKALLEHAAIVAAVVVVQETASEGDSSKSHRQLVAHLVAQEPNLGRSELRRHVGQRLPDHMVPSHFRLWETLPSLPNGKVDRKSLKDLRDGESLYADTFVAPRGPVEELLAETWEEVLHAPCIGAEDNFFDLGGHSLLATQVIARMRQVFEVDIELRTFFETPTIAALAARIAMAKRGGAYSMPPLVAVSRNGPLPLSFAQQRLWLLDRLAPGNSAYNMPGFVTLHGSLDREALRRAFCELVARHESLRTRFPLRGEEPFQEIVSDLEVVVPSIHLDALPEKRRRPELGRILQEEQLRPFQLTEAPLLRVRLIRLASQEHTLAFNLHHIASDGWSMGIFFREIIALYEAFLSGRPSPLPALAVQYADYAVWQRQWLSGEVLTYQLDYWKSRLAGAPRNLELPYDRPRPQVDSLRGSVRSFRLSTTLKKDLANLARSRSATLSMALLTGMKSILTRYSGQTDLAVGMAVANRQHLELEPLIGFFVNTLVLRTDLGGAPGFGEALDRVREVAIGAYTHQDLPFDRLVEELETERQAGRNPLTQVMFGMQNVPQTELEVHGLTFSMASENADDGSSTSLQQDGGTSKFDLTLILAEEEEGLLGSIEFRSDLFDATTIQRLAGHYSTFLQQAVASTQTPISVLTFFGRAEHHQILTEWNVTESVYPSGSSLQELFESRVELAPDALAAVFGENHLSYRELNLRSDRLASYLRRLGVMPESRVGLAVDRSTRLLVGMLGILKAGAAYVPLDRSYPQERLDFMVEDMGLRALVTERGFMADQDKRIAVVQLDRDGERLRRQPAARAPVASCGSSLAYVIYTSGSTGRPKGVGVEHRAVSRLVLETDYVRLEESDRVAQLANTSFDAVTFEIWGPLLNGGTVIGVGEEEALDPALLGKRIFDLRITSLFLTTALFNQTARFNPTAFRSVRHLLVGGEELDPGWIREVLSAGPPKRLINAYGPTESTTFATWHLIRALPVGAPSIPIGRPIQNTRLYVLDRFLEVTPPRVAGELCLGGDGLARGYLGRASLTAIRFIPDFCSDDPGTRLYRTGDLVRRRGDGTVDFLGRFDHQVKIRGFRIELPEIERMLASHSQVRETVVLLRDDLPEGPGLVAYTVLGPGDSLRDEDLKDHLLHKLPAYMVPAHFVILNELPLTPNGKVDRKALEAPSAGRRARAPEKARTLSEELLLEIWRELFENEQLGVEADFFELGGHSLVAVQLTSRVRDVFQVEMELSELFEHPTPRKFAARLQANQQSEQGVELPSIQAQDRTRGVPLSFAQRRLWLLDDLEVDLTAYNIPMALRLEGKLDVVAFARSMSEIIRRHESLRTVFGWREGHPSQEIIPWQGLELPVVSLSSIPESAQERELERMKRAEAEYSFDLAVGPLLHVTLVALAPQTHVILLNMHHIISDGWSMSVLMRELTALYTTFRGRPEASSPLEELEIQYADYALWQKRCFEGTFLERLIDYWRGQLDGAAPVLDLPTDYPRPVLQSYRGDQLPCVLSRALTRELQLLARRSRATLFMTLLATFKLLLSRYAGQPDVVVGVPSANRHRRELEPLIGFFVNMLAMRTDLRSLGRSDKAGSREPTFVDLLRKVRTVALGAYAHENLPFEMLVEELQLVRRLDRSPVFQVTFQLFDVGRLELRLPDLAARTLSTPPVAAKHDLGLHLHEVDGQVVGDLDFATSLFDRTTAVRMRRHFVGLLQAVVDRPHSPLGELSFLDPAEHQQILLEWNDTHGPFATSERLLHSPIEHWADRTPDSVVLTSGDEFLSYQELERRANRLALALLEAGAGPETVVALALERSVPFMVALLGVLKSGSAYLPIDPTEPPERFSFVLADAGVSLVLHEDALTDRLGSWPGEALPARHLAEILRIGIAGRPQVRIDPEHPAYVLYTSGSTGKPKGVVVSHRAIVNHMQWMGEALPLRRSDVGFQKTPLNFDASIAELYAPLWAGARLVLARPDGHRDATYLASEGLSRNISVLHVVPTLLRMLVEEPRFELCRLRRIYSGGEALPIDLKDSQLERFDGELINWYGPTEATIHATYAVTALGADRSTVTVGRPIRNATVRVLDTDLRALPPGARGEIYLGGDGLARGYIRRTALSAERFLPDPYATLKGERLYRTGDLARLLDNGALEFLGRRDHQVKIRGFRVELGEIEAVLRSHPEAQEAVAMLRHDVGGGDPLLVGYLIAESSIRTEELRDLARRSLPAHMVPAAFLVLQHPPLLPSGKLDRERLPAPRLESDRYEAPRDGVELKLTKIWEDLLQVERVGVTDDFFALGGHSLLAMRMVARIETEFGRKLPLAVLFRNTSVENLAQALRGDKGALSQNSLVCLQPAGSEEPFFFAHAVDGSVLSYLDLAAALGTEQPFYGLQARGLEGSEPPFERIEDMAAHYVSLILQVQPQGPYRLGGWSMGGIIAFEMARQLQDRGKDVLTLVLIDSRVADPAHRQRRDDPAFWVHFAEGLGLNRLELDVSLDEFRRLSEEDRLSRILKWAHSTHRLPESVGLEQLRALLHVYEANVGAFYRYSPQPIEIETLVYEARERVALDGLTLEPGWRDLVLGGLEVRSHPGNHRTILRGENASSLAEQIRTKYSRAHRSSIR